MNIRTIGSIKRNGEYIVPGSELDVPDDEAQTLIEAGAAVILNDEPEEIEEPAQESEGAQESDAESQQNAEEQTEDDPEARDDVLNELRQVKGVTKAVSVSLYEAGFRTIESLQAASETELERLPGIDAKRAAQIVKDAAEFIVEDE